MKTSELTVLVLSHEPVNNLRTTKLVCSVTGSTGEAGKMPHPTNNTSHLRTVCKFVTWHAEFLTTGGNDQLPLVKWLASS